MTDDVCIIIIVVIIIVAMFASFIFPPIKLSNHVIHPRPTLSLPRLSKTTQISHLAKTRSLEQTEAALMKMKKARTKTSVAILNQMLPRNTTSSTRVAGLIATKRWQMPTATANLRRSWWKGPRRS
jgi:hypothetical protein